MSYILEALKKSEHARYQGKVPDLTTMPIAAVPVDDGQGLAWRLPATVAALGLAVVAAALAWRPWAASEVGSPVTTPAVVTPQAPAPAAVAAAPAQTASAAVPPQAETAAAPSYPAAATPVLPAAAPNPPPPAAAVATGTATPAAPVPKPAATAMPAPPDRVLAFHELPESIRGALPALAVSGFSYTDEPPTRMAVINDRILREGEHAADGVTLERVGSDGIILNYRGFRFRP